MSKFNNASFSVRIVCTKMSEIIKPRKLTKEEKTRKLTNKRKQEKSRIFEKKGKRKTV